MYYHYPTGKVFQAMTELTPTETSENGLYLNKKSPIPLHTQMENLIRAKLASGEWPASCMLPSENELGKALGVSRITVRNVITKFVQEGLISRIPGKGTYVSESKFEARSLAYAGVREQLEQKGFEVSTKLLHARVTTVPERVSRNFSAEAGNRFYEIVRIRNIKDLPFSIHTSYVPELLAPKLDACNLESAQLCYILGHTYNLNRGTTKETLESVAATNEQAKLLNVAPNCPLLLLSDVISTSEGAVFEYAEVAFRGERIKLSFEF